MFSLSDQRAKLSNVNPRAELHGTDHKLACDLQIEIKVSNTFLDEFDPNLKDAFYVRSDDEQLEFAVIADVDHRTERRFPLLGGPLKWAKDFTGYDVLISYGLGGPSDIELGDCKVDKFAFLLQEGGTVVVTWRVQAHPDSEDTGKLCELIQQEITISLIPPTDTGQGDLVETESEERTEARQGLHDLFKNPDDSAQDPDGDDAPRETPVDESQDEQEVNPLAIE